jgi:hypothetical protein
MKTALNFAAGASVQHLSIGKKSEPGLCCTSYSASSSGKNSAPKLDFFAGICPAGYTAGRRFDKDTFTT